MINREQAGELLNAALGGRRKVLLEALYSAVDEPTKALLAGHPDLRMKAHIAAEARIHSDQSEQDYRDALVRVRDVLAPEIRQKYEDNMKQSSDACEQQKR